MGGELLRLPPSFFFFLAAIRKIEILILVGAFVHDHSSGSQAPDTRGSNYLIEGVFVLIFTLMLEFPCNIHAPSWQPDGSDWTIRVGEVTSHTLPQSSHGSRPSQSTLRSQTKDETKPIHRKKAYIKALKRATLHGMTWYRGQFWTAGPVSWELNPRTILLHPPPTDPRVRITGATISVFSWNIGQLSVVKWDMFRAWLQGPYLDCICLQATGWSFSGEWQDNDYAFVHVGAIEHRGGLHTAVLRKNCNVDSIAWTTPLDSLPVRFR